MSHDQLPPVTDPSLYPRIPDSSPPSGEDEAPTTPSHSVNRGRNAKGQAIAGIVAAGAIAIGIGVAVTSQASASAQANGQAGFGSPAGGPGGQFGGGPGAFAVGGRPAGQLVMGTMSAVGAGSISIRTTAGTATYTVSSSTRVIVDGSVGRLADLKAGDTVIVQVATTGSTTEATRIIVGGPGGGPGGAQRVQAPATTT